MKKRLIFYIIFIGLIILTVIVIIQQRELIISTYYSDVNRLKKCPNGDRVVSCSPGSLDCQGHSVYTSDGKLIYSTGSQWWGSKGKKTYIYYLRKLTLHPICK